jgi:hypothetical protein
MLKLCNVFYDKKREGTSLEKVEVMVKAGCQRKKEPKLSIFASVCVSADVS